MRRLIIVLLIALPIIAEARERSVIREFRKLHPCPSTGLTVGRCPTHVVDHKCPLCMGCPDHVNNLQWQEKQESYRKDVDERRLCRWLTKPVA